MMTAERLYELCLAVRERREFDDALVADIESDVVEYRDVWYRERNQFPPDELRDRLWFMGWLIYETSWFLMGRVPAAFELLGGEQSAKSTGHVALIVRLADAARRLPWPEFAPRSLGAIRAQALASSKRDTRRGYDDAWVLHVEGRLRYRSLKESLKGADSLYQVTLEETLLQLALAETGTFCRTAERVIGRWPEGIDGLSPQQEARQTQRMFQELCDGVVRGEEALGLVATIERDYGLVQKVSEKRLALVTAYRNPGIMTARALLLLVPMCGEMKNLRRRPPGNHDSWEDTRRGFLVRFERAYRAIEKPVLDAAGEPKPLSAEHARSLVQIRLNLALLAPGYSLPAKLVFDPCLELDPLDDQAVEAMSRWLAEPVEGVRRGDANVIGSATMPSYLRAVDACRAEWGAADGYRQWRSRWFALDKYSDESGRRTAVEQALGVPLQQP